MLDGTLIFSEARPLFENVDLDSHLSVSGRCMLQVHIVHQDFGKDLVVDVLRAKMILQT